jgi:hypothetical protein
MKLRVHVCFPVVVMLCAAPGLRAQGPEAAAAGTGAAAQNNTTTNVVPKPARKPDQVITNDSIALLAVRRAAPAIVPPSAETAKKDEAAAADEAAKRAAEIALVEKQIKDKQKRITLLMRLFVNDEQAFLRDPGNTKADPVAVERRQYEQDELRWETAELAKLKARWEVLTGISSR